MTRFPTLSKIALNIKGIFFRFPLAVVASLVATASALVVVNNEVYSHFVFFKLIWLALFAFVCAVAVALVSEKLNLRKKVNTSLQILASLVCFGYYLFLPPDLARLSDPSFVRLLILSGIAFIFFISFSYDLKDSLSLWKYWTAVAKALMIGMVLALGISLGLQLAYMAVHSLFRLDFWEGLMMSYWSVSFSLLAPLIFLYYLPSVQTQPLEKERFKLLDLFINYVWLPAVALFFVILYVYLGKIVFTWNWPTGGVAYWIIAFSIIGILGYIFAYGYLEERVRKIYFTLFFALIVPMAVVLFMAISFRLRDYGITESRYMVVAAGIWLLLVSLYALFSRTKKISFIPYITIFILLVSVIGPWSMFSVSANSQVKILRELLVKNNILVDGKIVKVADPKSFPAEEFRRVYSILNYISKQDYVARIQPWFSSDLSLRNRNGNRSDDGFMHYYDSYNTIVDNALFEMRLHDYWSDNYNTTQDRQNYFEFTSYKNGEVINTKGYDFFIDNVRVDSTGAVAILADFGQINLSLDQNNTVHVVKNGARVASVDMRYFVNKLGKLYETSGMSEMYKEDGISVYENETFKGRLKLTRAMFFKVNDGWQMQNITIQLVGAWKK